jgi:Cdc6-like AAA superfamily ATPase
MIAQPFYLEWDAFSTLAIAGASGSGKTTTTRFILCQLVLNDCDVIVCDPHGNIPNQSLAQTVKPLEHLFMCPIAITKQERIAAIEYVNSILLARLKSNKTTHRKLALIIDETTAHFLECSREEIALQARMFLRLANEARKTNIRVFLLGQNWKRDFIGSRDVRSSINAYLFHRISEDEIKLFIPSASAEQRRNIAKLKSGYAYLHGAAHYMQLVKIPEISQDSIQLLASQESRNDSRYDSRYSNAVNDDNYVLRDSINNMPKNVEKRFTQKNHDKLIELRKAILNNEGKEKSITRIFHISKGSKHKPWIVASKLYDRMYELMQEQGEIE